jgi:hypothetical protein
VDVDDERGPKKKKTDKKSTAKSRSHLLRTRTKRVTRRGKL